MNEKEKRENAFEKSFTPFIKDVRENEYTNSKGEQKKQCFITINPNKHVALIMPGSKEEIQKKYPNQYYGDHLNIPIPKDFQFRIVEGQGNDKQFRELSGTELRKEIDYYISINLDKANIRDVPDREGVTGNRVSVFQNGYSFIIPKDWIKEGQYGKFISVKHNATIDLSQRAGQMENGLFVPQVDENGKNVYKVNKRSWAYVKKAFTSQRQQNKEQDVEKKPTLDSQIAEANLKADDKKQNVQKQAKENQDIER